MIVVGARPVEWHRIVVRDRHTGRLAEIDHHERGPKVPEEVGVPYTFLRDEEVDSDHPAVPACVRSRRGQVSASAETGTAVSAVRGRAREGGTTPIVAPEVRDPRATRFPLPFTPGESPSPEARVCTGCRRELPAEGFAVDRSKASGRKSRCKDCDAERSREWYAQNAERRLRYQAERYEAAQKANRLCV